MDTQYRKYIRDENLEAFKAGFDEALGYKQHVQVIRLCVRTIHRNTVIAALIGIVDKPGGRLFELPLPKDELTRRRWTALGAEMGRAAEGWLAPRFQDPLQATAAASGKSVWNTHELEELAQDAIDHWEASWRMHLNGNLHARAKAALIKMFSREMMSLLEHLAAKKQAENDEAAAQNGTFPLAVKGKPGRKKMAEGVDGNH